MKLAAFPTRLAAALVAFACIGSGYEAAHADEIIVRDLDSGETRSIHCWGVTSETWSEVKYKERERGAEESVPTITVVEIKRTGNDKTAASLESAIAELDRGNYREATDALNALSGGGWKQDQDTGLRRYVSFSTNDPSGRNRRPPWTSEYAHFFYAKALYLNGSSRKDRAVLEEALLAIDDVPVPGGDGKETTGGFLGRFAGGNSRWYPEALDIKANLLVGLGRHDQAAPTFTELHNQAIRVPLEPRWAYAGKIGDGIIAEAKGDATGAEAAYTQAADTMELLLRDEQRRWIQQEYGKYYSRARMQTASVKLRKAEDRKAASAFAELRTFIKAGMPEALRERGMSRGMPPSAIDALVAGARDPAVQAVGLNGIGLAYLNEPKPKYEQALLAFKSVVVKYFQVPEQPARALFYLARAAAGAAKEAESAKKADVRDMYLGIQSHAVETLRRDYAGTSWANK
jgi:tetratricopeptide (TPR) repeat protein